MNPLSISRGSSCRRPVPVRRSLAGLTTSLPQRPIRLLLLEQDAEVCRLLSRHLTELGMQIRLVERRSAIAEPLRSGQIDLLLAGFTGNPEVGLKFCRELRMKSDVPLILLVNHVDAQQRAAALDFGADDCISRPFDLSELVARIHGILRRSQPRQIEPSAGELLIDFAGWRLDKVQRQLWQPDQRIVPLSNAEFRLLSVLIERAGQVLARDALLDLVRGRDIEPFERSIDLLISRLRHKLCEDPKNPQIIKTLRGKGYWFAPEVLSLSSMGQIQA